ncbi:hypothetical protein IAU60_001095 [Kwoniella sp. DSM 27419]
MDGVAVDHYGSSHGQVQDGNDGIGGDDPSLSLVELLQDSAAGSSDLSSPAATAYLDQLLSLSLGDLLRQPALISAESSTVESDLTNLCFREYPTFISVHKCSSAVKSAFDDFSNSLGHLIGAVPTLEDECRSFSTTTSSIQRVRGKAALVQEHQDKLQDLLELPQLMETCVRNGYYQEAMELLNHCHSLSLRYSAVALVQDVYREVENILQLMLAQLLALLREPVKLPALVKTVSFLRRLEAMNETELGLVFISSRYYNFRAQLLTIERDKAEPVRYLRRYIDLFREHVYDIIAQFTAIFLEASPSDDATVHITAFANQAITELVDLIHTYIPRIASDPASMSSILVQLGYCAMSFSRVGLDFAPLISSPFTSTVLSTFSQAIASSTNDFASILRDSSKAVLPPSQVLVVPEHIPSLVSATISPPPLPTIDSVSSFPPIATLINAHLTAFNNLRLLAPLSLFSQLVSLHVTSLITTTSVLLQYVTLATTLSEEPTQKSRPTHSRTPSAPRSDLLRRNSEVLMTPEARAAKRREAKRVCVATANVWGRLVVPFLIERLKEGVFAEVQASSPSTELETKLEELSQWVKSNGEGVKDVPSSNGKVPKQTQAVVETRSDSGANTVSTLQKANGGPSTPPLRAIDSPHATPRTPPTVSSPPTSTPPSFASPFRSAGPATDASRVNGTNGINTVFDSPRAIQVVDSPSTVTENAVPEPADLRNSAAETVENMEAQLEAMSIGLSGEAAAIALDIKRITSLDTSQPLTLDDGKVEPPAEPIMEDSAALAASQEGAKDPNGSGLGEPIILVADTPADTPADVSEGEGMTIVTDDKPDDVQAEDTVVTPDVNTEEEPVDEPEKQVIADTSHTQVHVEDVDGQSGGALQRVDGDEAATDGNEEKDPAVSPGAEQTEAPAGQPDGDAPARALSSDNGQAAPGLTTEAEDISVANIHPEREAPVDTERESPIESLPSITAQAPAGGPSDKPLADVAVEDGVDGKTEANGAASFTAEAATPVEAVSTQAQATPDEVPSSAAEQVATISSPVEAEESSLEAEPAAAEIVEAPEKASPAEPELRSTTEIADDPAVPPDNAGEVSVPDTPIDESAPPSAEPSRPPSPDTKPAVSGSSNASKKKKKKKKGKS